MSVNLNRGGARRRLRTGGCCGFAKVLIELIAPVEKWLEGAYIGNARHTFAFESGRNIEIGTVWELHIHRQPSHRKVGEGGVIRHQVGLLHENEAKGGQISF